MMMMMKMTTIVCSLAGIAPEAGGRRRRPRSAPKSPSLGSPEKEGSLRNNRIDWSGGGFCCGGGGGGALGYLKCHFPVTRERAGSCLPACLAGCWRERERKTRRQSQTRAQQPQRAGGGARPGPGSALSICIASQLPRPRRGSPMGGEELRGASRGGPGGHAPLISIAPPPRLAGKRPEKVASQGARAAGGEEKEGRGKGDRIGLGRGRIGVERRKCRRRAARWLSGSSLVVLFLF
ncbi:Hypothetical predicted protein [Podarcis lilfordi]|uniref:Uncharacterized protein n=1 Tax=Podarcis lilfordi TaxID=74358 RepID=A0AA35JWA1_9SAUR|nr:Hypothetical predicted protein [Podarcis lilfordi]